MDTERGLVHCGLRQLFIGHILMLVGVIPSFVGDVLLDLFDLFSLSLLGIVLSLLGLVVALTGLEAHALYRKAFVVTVVSAACTLISGFFGILELVGEICAFLQVYFVCAATDAFMDGEGLGGTQESRGYRGAELWKLYLGCTVVMLVGGLLLAVPVINILAGFAALLALLARLFCGGAYLVYLHRWSGMLV